VVLPCAFDNHVVNHAVLYITYITEKGNSSNKKARVVIGNGLRNTVRSEIRCALRLRYVDMFVSIEVVVEVCCCFTVFSC
jgi:hypothetical protein